MRRGNAYLWKDELDAAIKDSDEALKLDPKNATAHLYRARVLRRMGRRVEAIHDCDEALRINPMEYWGYELRAEIFRDDGNNTAALADVETVLRLNPKWTAAYVTRALIHFHANELDKSIANCSRLLEISPDAISTYIIRARAYARKNQCADAKSDFEFAVANMKPEELKYRLNEIAWVHATSPMEELRDGKKAIDEATKSCEIYGWRDAFSLEALAAGYAELGKFDEAINYENKALEFKPGIAERKRMEQRMALYQNHVPYREGPER